MCLGVWGFTSFFGQDWAGGAGDVHMPDDETLEGIDASGPTPGTREQLKRFDVIGAQRRVG
jgi:hypothetical protein